MRLASSLPGAQDLTIVTNGPDTFNALQGRAGLTPILTGGRLDPATGSLVGPIACRSAAQFTVERFITSAAAIDAQTGATEATLDEADVKRALAAGAGEVVLATDASKLEQHAVALALEWDARLARYRSVARVV
jgi:DeoR family fructose operon transcriptional repressor